MKLLSVLFLLFSFSAFADDGFKILPLDPSIDLNEVPQGIAIEKGTGLALTPKERDIILNRLFPHELSSFDNVDREILYRSITNYDKARLLKKYSFINEKNYQKVKDAFR